MSERVRKDTFKLIQCFLLQICEVEGRFFLVDRQACGVVEDF
jgi:hypothetical protein